MNLPRVVEIQRQIAALARELEEALEEDAAKDRSRRPRRPLALVRPPGESDDVARAKARSLLRKHGFTQR